MVLGRKAQIHLFGFMVGLTLIILALALAPVMKERSDEIRNETYDSGVNYGLNCSSSTLGNYDKATCYAVDLNMPLFIGGLIFIAGVYITMRFGLG